MPDYLVDQDGPPDPEVERLEKLLGRYRYPERPVAASPPPPPPRRRRVAWTVTVAAISVAAAAVIFWFLVRPRRIGWTVESLAGAPRCDGRPCGTWAPGDALVTDGQSRARVALGRVGHLDVAPGTALHRGAAYHLSLLHGEVHAEVVAPPRLVLIETPSATAVDLGCAYTLRVDDAGEGRLAVTSGWVALEAPAGIVFVPRGAEAPLHAGGPGTPFFDDAPAALRSALGRLDSGDDAAFEGVLAAARRPDTLSLFNLLPRLEAPARAEVLDRMLALGAPVPASFSRERILAADPAALEAWRHVLSAIWL